MKLFTNISIKPTLCTIKSITFANGCEFAWHEEINKELNIKSYLSEVEIQYVQDWINNRPMKILNYLTPMKNFKS